MFFPDKIKFSIYFNIGHISDGVNMQIEIGRSISELCVGV